MAIHRYQTSKIELMVEYTETLTQLAEEVETGLSAKNKHISSKYFYDDEGSRIFRQIMAMPEYYLTDCEYEVFTRNKKEIASSFCEGQCVFDIIELGAGDGTKTQFLLKYFVQNNYNFQYIPIDISEIAIKILSQNLRKEIPELNIKGKVGDYFEMMEDLNRYDHKPKIIMFLGSNIGNFSFQQSVDFFNQLASVMNPSDKLFIGFDLKKDPAIIQSAYNDPHGHTRDFNLNLLTRINRELGADFDRSKFRHVPHYDVYQGAAKSYIVSTCDQDVHIEALGKSYHFRQWESIYTEMSQKFDDRLINKLADSAGFTVYNNFYDSRKYFVNSLWKKTI